MVDDRDDLTLWDKKVSHTTTIVLLRLLICFLFWGSCMRTLCGQPSTLVKQREGIVNFRVCKDVKKQQIEEDKCSDIKSSLAKWTASRAVQWGYERSLMSLCHWKANQVFELVNERQPTIVRTGQMAGPAMYVWCFTGQSQSIKFFYFFWIKHNAQDRNWLAPRVPGVLCFGYGLFWRRIRI